MRSGVRRVGGATLVIVGVWTAIGAVAALQSVLITAGHPSAIPPATALAWQLPQWWAWAALTPLIVRVDARARNAGSAIPLLIGLHAVLGAATILVHSAVVAACDLAFFRDQVIESRFVPLVLLHLRDRAQFEVVSYLGLVGGWYAWDYMHLHQRQALASATLEADLAHAELRALESQIQPHFLFNTLQAIGALLERDAASARQALERLSDLLRSVLSAGGRPRVTLAEELAFLRRYLVLEHMRFQDRLTVDCAIDDEVAAALVPRFLLLPLVENALRHGLAPKPGPVRLDIRARRHDQRIELCVIDDGIGLASASSHDSERGGVGLEVTRNRLFHLHGDDGRLELEPRSGGGCIARVCLPFDPGAVPYALTTVSFHMAPVLENHA